MKCPVCKEESECVDEREAIGIKYTIHRMYHCKKCKMHYKSSEKVMFTSLPQNVKLRFLDEGKM